MNKKSALTQADWRAIKLETIGILVGLARVRKTIAYSELSAQMTTASIHYRAPAFDRILQELCADEVTAGRPILGVLVVNKQTGRCGAGFFKWCGLQGYNVDDPEQFWQAEFARVCDYWVGSSWQVE